MCMESRTRPVPSVPAELLKARSATSAYRNILVDLDRWATQVAAVNRTVNPRYAGQLDGLRDELRFALMSSEMGSVAGIERVLLEMLGESPCPGCDKDGVDVRQQADGTLVCSRCGRLVASS